MARYRNTTEPSFNGLSIMTDEQRDLSCREDILTAIFKRMNASVSQHRTLFTRFDLRFPFHYDLSLNNDAVTRFFNTFSVFLKRNNLEPQYVWVCEQSGDGHQHYHCLLLTHGRREYSYIRILQVAQRIWNQVLGLPADENNGLVNFCNRDRYGVDQKNGLILYPNPSNNETFKEAFYWASYMAKSNTKINIPGMRAFGYSSLL